MWHLFSINLFFKEFISAIHYALYIIATQDSPITINMDGSWGPIHLNAKIWFHAESFGTVPKYWLRILARKKHAKTFGMAYAQTQFWNILTWNLCMKFRLKPFGFKFWHGKNLSKISAWKNVPKFHAESLKFQVFYASGVELIRFWPVVWGGGYIFHWPQGDEKSRHNLKPLASKILLVQQQMHMIVLCLPP